MEKNFSISRYLCLITIDWHTQNKKYLFIFLAMIAYWVLYGFAATWFIMFEGKDIFSNPGVIRFVFNIQMLGFIGFIASNTFAELGPQINKSSYFLLLPCTTLEKFASRFMISAILFWGVFFASVFIGLALLWNVFYPIVFNNIENGVLVDKKFNIGHNIQVFTDNVFWMYAFFFHSIFTLGAVVIRRFKFIKSLLVIIVVLSVAATLRLHILPSAYSLSIYGVLTMTFWFIAYHRLKKYSI